MVLMHSNHSLSGSDGWCGGLDSCIIHVTGSSGVLLDSNVVGDTLHRHVRLQDIIVTIEIPKSHEGKHYNPCIQQ